ncbi:hypothetical protein ACVNIS_08080 [Sphaerotilaceae bacterium SBD11-9]
MTQTHSKEPFADVGSEVYMDRITVTTDFDRSANPELFAAMAAVTRGKQRAQRLRMLALKGLMVEQMHAMPGRASSGGVSPSPQTKSGADDVFGAPIDA